MGGNGRINKDDRAAGWLENYKEGRAYKDSAHRRFFLRQSKMVTTTLNETIGGPSRCVFLALLSKTNQYISSSPKNSEPSINHEPSILLSNRFKKHMFIPVLIFLDSLHLCSVMVVSLYRRR